MSRAVFLTHFGGPGRHRHAEVEAEDCSQVVPIGNLEKVPAQLFALGSLVSLTKK